jgi:hypothetical protein
VFSSTIGGGAWTPTGTVDLLQGATETFLAEGVLTSDQAAGLMDKLDAATLSISRGNTRAACGQLGAIVNQVNAMVNDGTLSSADGQLLIDAAAALRQQTGC